MNKNKHVKLLKYLLIGSIGLSILFGLIKIIFFMATIPHWQGSPAEKSIISTLVASGVAILLKSYKNIPRIIHFHKVHNSKIELNDKNLSGIIRTSLLVIAFYIWSLVSESIALNKVLPLTNSIYFLFPIYFALTTTPLSMCLMLYSMYLANKIRKLQ